MRWYCVEMQMGRDSELGVERGAEVERSIRCASSCLERDRFSMRMAPVVGVNVLVEARRCADEFISGGAEDRGDGEAKGQKAESTLKKGGRFGPTSTIVTTSNTRRLSKYSHFDKIRSILSHCRCCRANTRLF